MLTPLEAIAGLWILAAPTWGAASPPLSPPADLKTASAAARSADTPAALLELTDEELLARIEADLASLGSLSIGRPSSATLFNGVALPANPRWEIAPNADSWGTSETIAAIQAAVDTVHELFPDTPPIVIGDISAPGGGRLKRHVTHQGGRDVDFGFYYKTGKGTWFARGTPANLDLPRNWALVRALVTRTDVETILLDTRIQRVLYQYALGLGEAKDWLDRVFQFSRGSSESIIRHVAGHQTHYHVRFYSSVAQELGRRAHPLLVQLNIMSPPAYTVSHVVRSGQTLGHLAASYGTSVRAIMQANGIRTTQLRVGRAYRIPVRGAAAPPAQPIVVPHRLLPTHTPDAMQAVDWPTPDSLYGTPSER
jgi:penicillin-insensitive murein endopeptidase